MGVPVSESSLRAYYRGYSKTLSKITVASSLFFPLYEHLRQDHSLSAPVASMATATISTLIMQPLDYAKTRQIYGLPHSLTGQGPVVWLRSYYKGVGLNCARVIPHFTIVMVLIDFGEQKMMEPAS